MKNDECFDSLCHYQHFNHCELGISKRQDEECKYMKVKVKTSKEIMEDLGGSGSLGSSFGKVFKPLKVTHIGEYTYRCKHCRKDIETVWLDEETVISDGGGLCNSCMADGWHVCFSCGHPYQDRKEVDDFLCPDCIRKEKSIVRKELNETE